MLKGWKTILPSENLIRSVDTDSKSFVGTVFGSSGIIQIDAILTVSVESLFDFLKHD